MCVFDDYPRRSCGLSVDPDRRKRWRDGARSQHVIETDLLVPAIEISNLTTANADEPKRESRLAGINEVKINQLRQQFP